MTRLETIQKKLKRLAKLDARYEIFGADDHKYKFEPKLTEKEAEAFESRYDLRLPEEYRQYLLHVGNGGAGPFYGLMALEDSDDNVIDPAEPFPFEEPLYFSDVYEEVETITENMPEDEAEETGERIFDEYFEMASSGISYLSHEGCGMYSVLVVKGAEAGNVWFLDLANEAGAFPILDPETDEPFGFFDWFEYWLDNAIAHFEDGSEELSSYADLVDGGVFGIDEDDD
ncbi:MAG: SMI1/KNR4 family protein [Candidatus Accumulibacter sp.]|jgi:hypothetical protein|nr:SMI1/KNR4 family protein [Accumulibacter sp.]